MCRCNFQHAGNQQRSQWTQPSGLAPSGSVDPVPRSLGRSKGALWFEMDIKVYRHIKIRHIV